MSLFWKKQNKLDWGTVYEYTLNIQPDTVPDETLVDDGRVLVEVAKQGWSWILRSPRGLNIGHAETRDAAIADGRAAMERERGNE